MSITLVSSLPKPAPTATATATDSTTDSTAFSSTAAGQDFASLLLGQLLQPTNGTPEEITSEAEAPEGDKAPADPANLFAALGIIPTEVKPVAEQGSQAEASLPALGKTEASDAGALKALQPQPSKTEQQATPQAEITAQPTMNTPPTSEQPAKIAALASPLPEADALVSSKATETPATPNITALPQGTHGVQTAAPVRQDVQVSVPTPVRDQSWTNDFGQKVVWLASNDKQSAQITLNPPQMGPIEVSITMDKGSASASFVSANAEVRNNIETALPRLREMFANAGIELGQTNVSAESFKQQAGNDEWKSATPRWSNDNGILVTQSSGSLPASAFVSRQGNGRVDIFA